MKRLLVLLACTTAFVVLTASSATAAGKTFTPVGLTLTPSADTIVAGEAVELSGVFTSWFNGHRHVTVSMYDNGTCTVPEQDLFSSSDWTVTTSHHGAYSVDPITIDEPGTYSFRAKVTGWGWGYGTLSPCVSVTVTAPAEEETIVEPFVGPSSYLCWNQEMVDPVAYLDSIADQMWATGKYFEPQAVAGNVVGGTNLGAYHLVCNAQAKLTPTGFGLGGSGEVYPLEAMQAYHGIHSGANDLNLYHIYG